MSTAGTLDLAAIELSTAVGDVLWHPFPPSPSSGFASAGPSKALGPVQPTSFYGDVQCSVDDPTRPNTVIFGDFLLDCGIARIDIDSTCCGSTCTVFESRLISEDRIKDVRNIFDLEFIGTKVFEVGRTTRRTAGIARLQQREAAA